MSRIIGIDLGTTNSVVAVLEAGAPVVIPNDEGDRKTPSVVAYTTEGERLVGSIAKRQAILNPEQTVYSIKRFMGRRFSEVRDERKYVPYTVVAAQNGDARVEIDGRKLHPTEVSAQVLLKLKKAAEDFLGEPVTQAVITVPAYFNDAQRQATKDAGLIAGLEVKRIVNEPTAAAMAYGFDKKQDETIAVYDFGGGTFDISVLAIGDNVIRVLATNGDTHLGGDNIDDKIVDWLLGEFKRETGIDLSKDKVALQRLKDAAEKVKIELSSTLKREISLPFLAADKSGPRHLVRELTRSRLESMIDDLITATITPTLTCLADAKLRPWDIDEVILVGGSTRIPKVQQAVKTLFGKEPNKSVNPDEVVAIGAAVQAGVLSGDVKDLLLLDVMPLSLGIQTRGSLMTRIIERNTAIPIRESRIFTTSEDNMSSVEVHVLQGERATVAGNRTLGRFILNGIPPAPRGLPRISVTFDIDSNGIVNVGAKDLATGSENKIAITTVSALSQDEIDEMVFDADVNQAEDEARRISAELRVKAEQLISQSEAFIQANSGRMGSHADNVTTARQSVLTAIEALDAEQEGAPSVELLQQAIQQLQQELMAASATMFSVPAARPTRTPRPASEPQPEAAPVSYPSAGLAEPAFEEESTEQHAIVTDASEDDVYAEPVFEELPPAPAAFGDHGLEEVEAAPAGRRTFASMFAGAASTTARAIASLAASTTRGKPRDGESVPTEPNGSAVIRPAGDASAAATQPVNARVNLAGRMAQPDAIGTEPANPRVVAAKQPGRGKPGASADPE